MGRILAVDYGSKRCGVAVTDPQRIIASTLDTVPESDLMSFLKDYVSNNDVDIVVFGMPRKMDGSESDPYSKIKPFVDKFRKEMPHVEVDMFDERFTSAIAHRAIIEGGVPKMKRRDKALIDRVSASLILQDYMESLQYKNK